MNGGSDRQYVVCNNATVDGIQRRVKRLLHLLDKYSNITDAYVLDFFVANHWETLPQSWQRDLDDLEPAEVSELILNADRKCVKKVWPLSLLAFKAAMFAESVPRNYIKSPQPIRDFMHQSTLCENSKSKPSSNTFYKKDEWSVSAAEELNKSGGQHKDLHHILRRRIKPKKQHEIMRLLKVVKEVTDEINCGRIVDVGSGQGHLSRLLAFSTNLHVTSLEAESSHINGAQKIDDRALQNFKKEKRKRSCHNDETISSGSDEISNLPQHVNSFIPSNITSDQFVEILSTAATCDELNKFSHDSCFSLVGLHTCGNLATTLLKVFSRCPQAVGLFSVACCYMKLDEEAHAQEGNYPLSNYVKDIPNHHLSYVAREVACHAIEKYAEKLKGDASSLMIHCYRATLEALIVKQFPEMKHLGLRSVKRAHEMPFSRYSKEALKKTPISIADSNLISPFTESCTRQWKRVLVFYSIRLLLAMIVETVILFDRMVYLYEEGIDSCLIPLFDPSISPRNHVLIAIKRRME